MSLQTLDSGSRARLDPPAGTTPDHRWFAGLLILLAAALAVNTGLGPLGIGAIDYPISGTLLNQTYGLEIITAALVVPALVVAALLTVRRHRAAPFLAAAPAGYAAYMFTQYVLGPEYGEYSAQVLFHTAVFALSTALTVRSFSLGLTTSLPPLSPRARRAQGVVLLLLGLFIVSRYLPVIAGRPMPAEFDQARTFFWSIFLLDLGIVVPATVVTGVGLLRGARFAQAATYALMGWYALVPASVAAMSVAMVANDDPAANAGQALMLGAFAVVFLAVAAWILRALFGGSFSATSDLR